MKIRVVVKVILFIAGSVMFLACGDTSVDDGTNISKTESVSGIIQIDVSKLTGGWKDTSKAGLDMLLEKDGQAISLNSVTLKYSKWKLKGNKLTISSQSIGNGITFFSDDVYIIEQLNDSIMVLRSGSYVTKFIRKEFC
jgi:hypothetical protein